MDIGHWTMTSRFSCLGRRNNTIRDRRAELPRLPSAARVRADAEASVIAAKRTARTAARATASLPSRAGLRRAARALAAQRRTEGSGAALPL